MAKQLSVQEILAAARAEKAKAGAAPASPDATSSETVQASDPIAAGSGESAPPATEAASPAAAAPTPAAPPAKVAPGGKGMSMADILAAARAKSGPAPAVTEKPAKAAVAEKPKAAVAEKAAPAPAAAKPAAAKADAGAAAPKDTASILAAARKGAQPGPMTKAEAAAKAATPVAPAAKKKLAVPPMPAKPEYARPTPVAATPAGATRRSFFAAATGVLFGSALAIGFTSLAVTHLMWLLGLARFMFPNILIEPPTRFKVGFPDSLAPGQVETKFIPQFGVWIVRYEFDGQPMIFALKSVCTHLGCTPNWLEAEQKFKCPCHGSGFYKDGVNFEGPAPRPLERYSISLADDGQLLVDKSRTFQQELGQWKETASYVTV